MKLKLSALNRIVFIPGSIVVFLVWVNLLIATGALPDPIAIHWGITGQADGFVDRDSYLQIVAPALIIPWLLQVVFFTTKRRSPLIREFFTGILSIIYWMLFLILFFATTTQLSQASADQSTYPLGILGALIILIPIALWFSLAFPSLEMGSELIVRLRGVKVLSVPMIDVVKVEKSKLSLWNMGGLGIRASGNTLAFMPSKGDGIVFTLRSGEKIAVRSHNTSLDVTRAKEIIAS
jgi:hypothetical protein